LPSASRVQKVLIYRLGSLGDMVVALPCFHLIERRFPNAERVLLTNYPVHAKAPAAEAVLADSGLVHRYMEYKVGTRNVGDLLGLAWQIRRFSPDVLIYLMPIRPAKNIARDRRFFRLAAGVGKIIGLPGEDELKHRFDPAAGRFEPEASRLARSLRKLGDADIDDPANWDLRLSIEEIGAAAIALGPLMRRKFIACGPGTKMQAKDWGQDNWRELINHLHSYYPEHGLVMVGAEEDCDLGDYVAWNWDGPRANFCGKLTPRESAAVLAHAQVFIGPDSGPMHLAACAGVPCVIAFSARGLPGIWFPHGRQHQVVYHQTSCYGCNLETCTAQARRCLTSITVTEMATAVGRVLDA
jgi:heptosyltransferase III